MKCDSARLQEELISAGVTTVVSIRSGGSLDTLVWQDGHPTPAESKAAALVLAKHDPDSSAKEEAQRQADIQAALSGLDSLNPTVREDALIVIVRILAWYATR